MTCTKFCAAAVITTLGLAAAVTTFTIAAEPAKDAKPAAGAPEMKLPKGWTEDDMKACALAATPGKQHEYLAKGVGTWQGKSTMWMAPDSEPCKSDLTTTIAPIMDGRYTTADTKGEMPGMGPFHGVGTYGFDNVSGKFVSTWIDSMSTGIMTGTGELSADGKVLTWTFSYNCPITKKPTTMREIDTDNGPNSKTLEMYSIDPKSGKEYKMMVIEYTRKP